MPTPDQIEAMARAIHAEDASYLLPYDMLQYNVQGLRERQARAAIDACEATRPAVPSDEDLLEIFWDNSYPGSANNTMEPKEVYTDHLAGIRAVRDRLGGMTVPDLTE
jgi:hypothetical protein